MSRPGPLLADLTADLIEWLEARAALAQATEVAAGHEATDARSILHAAARRRRDAAEVDLAASAAAWLEATG